MTKRPILGLSLLVGALVAARMLLLQILALRLPLIVWDGHHWRQAFTYSVAWNYAHTTLDPFHPRMFVELAKSNVVAMEAPLYPLLASIFLRISDSVVGPRLLSFASLLAIGFVLWRWLELPERAGLLASMALAPIVAIEFRALQPEPLAAGFAMLSAFFLARFRDDGKRRSLYLGALMFGLSLLAKPLAFGIVPGLVGFAAWKEGKRWRRPALFVFALLALAAVPALAWDRWAAHLLDRDLAGDWIIQIEHDPKRMLRMLLGGQYSRETWLRGFASYATCWWLVPAGVVGLYRGLATRAERRFTVPMLLWAAGYGVELMAFGERLHSNAYYFILAAAPMAWLCALGLGSVVRFLDGDRPSVVTWRCALALLVLLPLGIAFSKGMSWDATDDSAKLGFELNRAVWTDDLGLARILLVMLLVITLAHRWRPRGVPLPVALPLLFGLVVLGIRPLFDTVQYFRFYTAADKREGFDSDFAHIREVFLAHSTPSDRIVVAPGGSYREPPMVYFFYANRNGFALREAPNLEELRRRGARLYFEVDQLVDKSQGRFPLPGRVIDQGRWWKVTCIAADGC